MRLGAPGSVNGNRLVMSTVPGPGPSRTRRGRRRVRHPGQPVCAVEYSSDAETSVRLSQLSRMSRTAVCSPERLPGERPGALARSVTAFEGSDQGRYSSSMPTGREKLPESARNKARRICLGPAGAGQGDGQGPGCRPRRFVEPVRPPTSSCRCCRCRAPRLPRSQPRPGRDASETVLFGSDDRRSLRPEVRAGLVRGKRVVWGRRREQGSCACHRRGCARHSRRAP